jgi:hypothetical protein
MFAKTIVTSDAFLDMPLSARCLYFTLGMFADDDGFVNNPKSVMRQVGASTDDLNLLLAKRFILSFDSGVIVIKHWYIHNYIRNDRYKETKYIEEKSTLMLDDKGAYTENNGLVYQTDTNGIPTVSKMDTQVKLGEVKLGKVSLGEDITTTTTARAMDAPILTEVYVYFKEWLDEGAAKEAEKFHAYNAKRGWDCLPDWKATADLWIARIGEDRRTKQ